MNLFKLEQLTKIYRLSKIENDFLKLIPSTYKKAWDGDLVDLCNNGILPTNGKAQRDLIKKRIKEKLLKIQGPYCIYCGIHFNIVGTAQREHIAHKDKYPQFTFTNTNLALACAFCNGFEKKSTKNTISTLRKKYSNCDFNIVHPYFDDVKDHIEISFADAKICLSKKNNSTKGENTIKMFKLMESIQASFRGAAYLRDKEEKRLKKQAIKRKRAVIINKYTF